MTSFFIEKSFYSLLAPMQNKEDPTSIINMTSMGKIALKLTKRTDKTTLSFAVKYEYGSEYHTDNSQKLSKLLWCSTPYTLERVDMALY